MDTEQLLRSHRKDLVLAAESAVRDAGDRLPEKSQLNRLVSICGEASCAEEIANYLLYQASRPAKPWPREFAELVIARIDTPLQNVTKDLRGSKDADRAKIAAWRLYAVFLARAFTYARMKKGNGHDRAR
jgi:hypothetical protein